MIAILWSGGRALICSGVNDNTCISMAYSSVSVLRHQIMRMTGMMASMNMPMDQDMRAMTVSDGRL